MRRGDGERGRELREEEKGGRDEKERETKRSPPTMTRDMCGQRRRNDLLPQ
jgi:hypothetical protein